MHIVVVVVSMCISSAEAPPGEPTLKKKHYGGRKCHPTLTSYSMRHSLLGSVNPISLSAGVTFTYVLTSLSTLLCPNTRRAARRSCRGLLSVDLSPFPL
ncbi:hypothetical protein V8E52_006411 [Russula decolorans]